MAVNIQRKKLEEDGTEEWTGLCSQLFANHTLDRCVCFRSGSRIFPVLLEPRRRRSLHKGGTRWNNTIFEEEEPERRSELDRDWREERRNTDFTTEGRESKRESQSGRVKETRDRRTERRDDQRGEEKRREEKERREVWWVTRPERHATSLSVTTVWMSSRWLESSWILKLSSCSSTETRQMKEIDVEKSCVVE